MGLLVFIAVNEVFATLPPFESYQRVVGDGKYVFVMLYEHSAPLMSSSGKQYPSSGMYLADGSNVPIWTVDGYWFAGGLFISSDGDHLVRAGILAPETAVEFYEQGKLLKRYTVADLVKDAERLPPRSTSHIKWEKNISFDETLDKLTIVTIDEQKYVFDVKTGNLE